MYLNHYTQLHFGVIIQSIVHQ